MQLYDYLHFIVYCDNHPFSCDKIIERYVVSFINEKLLWQDIITLIELHAFIVKMQNIC